MIRRYVGHVNSPLQRARNIKPQVNLPASDLAWFCVVLEIVEDLQETPHIWPITTILLHAKPMSSGSGIISVTVIITKQVRGDKANFPYPYLPHSTRNSHVSMGDLQDPKMELR